MWKTWNLPRNEGTRMHRFGDAAICVAVDSAGEGSVLAAMALYAPELPSKAARGGREAPVALPPLSSPSWTRSYAGGAETYELLPGYPPIPVCVRLRESFRLSPGSGLDGWIFSKLEARVSVNGSELGSFPLRLPFKTLYGIPQAGVVCRYDEADFLSSRESVMETLHADPALIAHPVSLRNSSPEPVQVTDLCIYGEQLSIFSIGTRLVSEALHFNFSASGVRMSMDGRGSLPPGATLVAKPRVSGEERFIERSFELFKAMTRI